MQAEIFLNYHNFQLKELPFGNYHSSMRKFRKTKNEAYYRKQVAKRHKKNKNKKTHRKKH